MNPIDQIFAFIIEIEKLKGVLRKTKVVGMDRYENSAEHSWHICLTALLLKQYANEHINIDRVIKMLLVHDLGEIDAGDTIVYATNKEEIKKREAEGFRRLMSLLPMELADELTSLWQEFEEGKTPEAIYANAMDRVSPVLQNLNNGGQSWWENNISIEQVYGVNSKIALGSTEVWENLKQQLATAHAKGILP